VRGLRYSIGRPEVGPLALGAALTAALALQAARTGEALTLGGLIVLTTFLLAFVGMLAAPHVTVAAIIPLFAAIPALKLFVAPWIGPLKDLVILAAATAVPVLVIRRRGAGLALRGDTWAIGLAGFLLGLYVLNLGGGIGPEAYDAAWLQAIRLAAEPILLLVVGLTIADAGRTLRWALRSLVATGVVVSLYGLAQQALGETGLLGLGYEYELHIKTFGAYIRSFGTLDDPFAYVTFLLFALTAVLFGMRRRPLTVAAGAVLLAGIGAAFVRTSVVILVALLGLWLARQRRTHVAALILGATTLGGVLVILVGSEATEGRAVRLDSPVYLTVNGRTDVWSAALGSPSEWPFGRGVGEVGTAADRAEFGVFRSAEEALEASSSVVDSGYFATVADVGVVGLIVLLALFGRLIALARRAIVRGHAAGWVAAGLLATILLDAVTRASFNGFPTAFLGLLLVGLALAAAEEADERALPAR
jgi:hypothetical protein